MRDRDRGNKNEIEIFVFSVTSNDFPHDMLLLTFSSNLGSKLWCRRYLHGLQLSFNLRLIVEDHVQPTVYLLRFAFHGREAPSPNYCRSRTSPREIRWGRSLREVQAAFHSIQWPVSKCPLCFRQAGRDWTLHLSRRGRRRPRRQ